MSKLNGTQKYEAKLPRTGFDIGRDIYYTSSVGHIIPIYRARLNPGETVDFSIAMKTILRPLRRPTQCKIRQKVDVFFVPEQMLYTAFGQHFYQTDDYVSSGFGFSSAVTTSRSAILPLLGFGNLSYDLDKLNEDTRESIDSLALQTNIEVDSTNSFSGFDSFGKSAFRLLMHLGYNPHVIFKKVNEDNEISVGEFSTFQPNVFPDFLLAYNAIYENYYRNDDREVRNLRTYQFDWADTDFRTNGAAGVASHFSAIALMTRCHQRIKDYFTSVKVSPVMSVLNLPSGGIGLLGCVNNYLFGSIGSSEDTYPSEYVSSPLTSDSSIDNNGLSNIFASFDDSVDSHTRFTSVKSSYDSISPANIRGIFAVEKLLRITGRARKNYDSQVLAHLGYKVPRDVKHEITFIGSIDGGIGVQTHMSFAETEYASLGEQFGNGSGNLAGKCRKFTAPCHGVFMAVAYSIPETSYPLGHYIDKLNNLTSRLDMYIPEFDRLGMQPMYLFEHYVSSEYDATQQSLNTGWQYRYEQYKRQYDVHSLAFYNPHGTELTNSWSPWVLGNVPYNFYTSDFDRDEDDVVTLNFQFPTPSSFIVSPCFLNGIFVQDYDPDIHLSADGGERNDAETPWLIFQTDPFMHAARINCKLVSTMSTYGEPELD